MGHPDRRKQRAKKKEELPDRKTAFNITDLTPQNAVARMNKNYDIRLK